MAAILGVTFLGPWPTYGPVDLATTAYHQEALAAIAASAERSERTASPGRLVAGWAKRPLRVPPGTPLAGYGDRRGKPSSGAHDPITVGALVLGDGADTVAIVASDLLVVTENVAEAVRSAVAERVPLLADDILFNASHTHSGPGAFAPGWLGSQFAGPYDPQVFEAIATTMTAAVVDAYHDLAPARLGQGRVAVPEHVHNRAREGAGVDPDLHVMRLEKEDGSLLTLVSYAAHATLVRSDNMELSADYPGALVRFLENETGGTAFFLAGAMGSMGPVAPEGLEGLEAAKAMGRSLAARVLDASRHLSFDDRLDVASVGAEIRMPPLQVRLNRGLRLSPFLLRRLGLNNSAWIQGVRLGRILILGAPADFSGEISVGLKAWAGEKGYDLWVLSFNGDFIGYVSPDRYYDSTPRKGRAGYEMYVMNWCGPQQEELLVGLMRRAALLLMPDTITKSRGHHRTW